MAKKKLNTILITLVVVLFVSVFYFFKSKDESNLPKNHLEYNYLDFKPISLKNYGLNISILVPDQTAKIGASVEPEVIYEENGFKWSLKVGENFDLIINDRGNENQYLETYINELNSLDMFKYNFIEKKDNLIIYQRQLDTSYSFSKKYKKNYKSYHVIGLKKIDGYYYSFESKNEGDQLQYIEAIAKSIESIKTL